LVPLISEFKMNSENYYVPAHPQDQWQPSVPRVDPTETKGVRFQDQPEIYTYQVDRSVPSGQGMNQEFERQ
jgi:hypothetical protein